MVRKPWGPRVTASLEVLVEDVRGQRASKREHWLQSVAHVCHTSPPGLPGAAWVPKFGIMTGEMSPVPTLACPR